MPVLSDVTIAKVLSIAEQLPGGNTATGKCLWGPLDPFQSVATNVWNCCWPEVMSEETREASHDGGGVLL